MKSTSKNKIDSLFRNKPESIEFGKIRITLPQIFGFCGGVVSALIKLENTVKESKTQQKIFLLGEIIHNPTVNRYFISSGVNIIPESNLENIFNIASVNDIIVIPAFGISLDLERKIRAVYRNVIDTTCKNVKSVWRFISQEAKKKSTIILYGKPGHPEVKASISRAGNSSCVIVLHSLKSVQIFAGIFQSECVENTFIKEELIRNKIYFCNGDRLNIKRLAFANQTTMLYNETLDAEKIIRQAANKNNFQFFSCDTICRATYLRQQAAEEVCSQQPDLIFVIGGYESSNTLHLYKLAQKYSKVYYLRDANVITESVIVHYAAEKELEETVLTTEIFQNVKSIVILAGASCPFTVIHEVIEKLKKISSLKILE